MLQPGQEGECGMSKLTVAIVIGVVILMAVMALGVIPHVGSTDPTPVEVEGEGG